MGVLGKLSVRANVGTWRERTARAKLRSRPTAVPPRTFNELPTLDEARAEHAKARVWCAH